MVFVVASTVSVPTPVATGAPCRSVIIPLSAGMVVHLVICDCPAARSASPWVVCRFQA